MRIKHRLSVIVVFFLLILGTAWAQPVPQVVKLQGFLSDRTGGSPIPANGSFSMTFDLYDAEFAGALIKSVGPLPIDVANGLYSANVPFPLADFDGPTRWIEITVNGEVLSPRVQLVTAPFAYVAATLDGREAAELEESAEIEATIAEHENQADAHPEYVDREGDSMSGPLVIETGQEPALTLANTGGSSQKLHLVGPGDQWLTVSSTNAGSESRLIAVSSNGIQQTNLDFKGQLRLIDRDDGEVGRFSATGLDLTGHLETTGRAGIGGERATGDYHLAVYGNTRIERDHDAWLHVKSANTGSESRLIAVSSNGIQQTNLDFRGQLRLIDRVEGEVGRFSATGLDLTGHLETTGRAGIGGERPTGNYHLAVYGNARIERDHDAWVHVKSAITGSESRLIAMSSNGIQQTNLDFRGELRIIDRDDGEVGRFKNGRFETPVLRITGGSDISEPFVISTDDCSPGSVLVIDSQSPGALLPSHEPYDTRVAGVASGAGGVRPGLTLHQEDAFEVGVQVALSGRVYVQATSENGPISPGDLLTSSSTPGHAMRATDTSRIPGAIIGKAMSELNEGEGLVLALVNLH